MVDIFWNNGGKPGNEVKASGIFAAVQLAAADAKFANFKTMRIQTGPHTSKIDPVNHATVIIKTAEQTENNTHQVAHIYIDKDIVQVMDSKGKMKTEPKYIFRDSEVYPEVKSD